jgi:DNA-binding transcriptional LysR family regulator
MSNTYLQHPTESALERFLLHNNDEVELDAVESHILTCEPCLTRLEILEVQITATKLAFQNIHRQEAAKAAAKQRASFRSWLTFPRLSMVGALAALALGIGILPQFSTHNESVAQISLAAYRGGLGISTVPVKRRLRMHLDASQLNKNNVAVQLVDERGAQVWETIAAVREDEVVVDTPRIGETGSYFIRIYSFSTHREGDLLREFAFNVQ